MLTRSQASSRGTRVVPQTQVFHQGELAEALWRRRRRPPPLFPRDVFMESVSVARLEREIEMPYPALFFKHRGKQGFQFCHSEVSFFFFLLMKNIACFSLCLVMLPKLVVQRICVIAFVPSTARRVRARPWSTCLGRTCPCPRPCWRTTPTSRRSWTSPTGRN